MAVLTMERRRRPVATNGKGFGFFFALLGAARFAADCHWLQPRGSIKAPSAAGQASNLRIASQASPEPSR
jgi:hypothetical protein